MVHFGPFPTSHGIAGLEQGGIKGHVFAGQEVTYFHLVDSFMDVMWKAPL